MVLSDAPSRPRWTLALTSVAFFMVTLDALVVITALPAIHRDLGASLSTLQWTVNAYTLAFAAAIITAAALGDRFGRRRIFSIGLVLFALASAACAIAPTVEVLIGARAIQGVAAGAVMPLSLTILTAAFPAARRGAMIGIWGAIAGIAVAGGPLVGGALTQGLSWHWIFWVNVPIGLIAAALSMLWLTESLGPPTRLDLAAVALVSGGAFSMVLSLVRAADQGWTSVATLVPATLGLVLMAAFIIWESRADQPMLPVRLFRSLTFSAANATAFFMAAAQFAAAFLVAQYFQLGLGLSPLDTGIRMLPWTATPLVVAPLAGALSDRIGSRQLMVAGMVLQAAGFAVFALVVGTRLDDWQAILPLVVAGIGVSMVLPVTPSAILSAVAPQDMGKGSAVNSMLQRFGSAFGVAIATAVFAGNGSLLTPDTFAAGFRPALLVAACLSVLGALTAVGVGKPRAMVGADSSASALRPVIERAAASVISQS